MNFCLTTKRLTRLFLIEGPVWFVNSKFWKLAKVDLGFCRSTLAKFQLLLSVGVEELDTLNFPLENVRLPNRVFSPCLYGTEAIFACNLPRKLRMWCDNDECQNDVFTQCASRHIKHHWFQRTPPSKRVANLSLSHAARPRAIGGERRRKKRHPNPIFFSDFFQASSRRLRHELYFLWLDFSDLLNPLKWRKYSGAGFLSSWRYWNTSSLAAPALLTSPNIALCWVVEFGWFTLHNKLAVIQWLIWNMSEKLDMMEGIKTT